MSDIHSDASDRERHYERPTPMSSSTGWAIDQIEKKREAERLATENKAREAPAPVKTDLIPSPVPDTHPCSLCCVPTLIGVAICEKCLYTNLEKWAKILNVTTDKVFYKMRRHALQIQMDELQAIIDRCG